MTSEMVGIDLSETEKEMLIELYLRGGASPTVISREIDANANYVSERLSRLESLDITQSDSGVWYLTPYGCSLTHAVYVGRD